MMTDRARCSSIRMPACRRSPRRFPRVPPHEVEGWQRDMPPSVTSELAERFRELAARFPEAELRKWLSKKEVNGLRSRLNDVVNAAEQRPCRNH